MSCQITFDKKTPACWRAAGEWMRVSICRTERGNVLSSLPTQFAGSARFQLGRAAMSRVAETHGSSMIIGTQGAKCAQPHHRCTDPQTICRMMPQPNGMYRITTDAIVSPETAIDVMAILGAKVDSDPAAYNPDKT